MRHLGCMIRPIIQMSRCDEGQSKGVGQLRILDVLTIDYTLLTITIYLLLRIGLDSNMYAEVFSSR
jgi:hypothetical protein